MTFRALLLGYAGFTCHSMQQDMARQVNGRREASGTSSPARQASPNRAGGSISINGFSPCSTSILPAHRQAHLEYAANEHVQQHKTQGKAPNEPRITGKMKGKRFKRGWNSSQLARGLGRLPLQSIFNILYAAGEGSQLVHTVL